MASATFYTTAKRHNSTAIPTGGTVMDVFLKDGSDLLTPTFKINHSGTPNWSMMQFEGRYYFITDITSLRQDLWEISAAVDVLATYKSVITGSSAFVLYDTAANSEIIDDRLAAQTSASASIDSTPVPDISATGSYVLSVIGKGGTSSWILPSTANLTDLITASVDNVLGTVPPTQPTIIEQLQASIDYLKGVFVQILASGKAPDAVRSCYWLPWTMYGQNGRIFLGDYDSGVNGDRIITPIMTVGASVSIPWQASDWRRNAPYHQIYLYMPFIGVINIPPSAVMGCSSLNARYSLNKLDGSVSVRVTAGSLGSEREIGTYSAQTGVSIPIGSSNISPAQMFNSLLTGAGAIAGIMSGAPMAGAGAIAGLTAATRGALVGTPSAIGGGGGGAAAGQSLDLTCVTVFHDTNVAPASVAAAIGTPSFAYKSLSGLSGYVQTHSASVSGSMTDTEREMINSLLNGGIFIE